MVKAADSRGGAHRDRDQRDGELQTKGERVRAQAIDSASNVAFVLRGVLTDFMGKDTPAGNYHGDISVTTMSRTGYELDLLTDPKKYGLAYVR